MLKLPYLLLLGLLAAPLHAQDAAAAEAGLPAQDPVVDAIYAVEDTQVMEHLDELVNGIGPRLTSSTNLTEACLWAADRFRDFGVPEVRLEQWGEFPVGFDRIYSRGRMVQPRKTALVFTTRAWTAGTDGPVQGKAVLGPRDEEQMEAMAGTLAGAWVLFPRVGLAPVFDSDDEGDPRAALGRFLDQEGIAGVVVASRSGELVRTSGNSRISWDDLPTRVSVELRRDQFADLLALLEAGEEEVILEFDIRQEFVKGPIPLYNVIAEVPGTDLADQLVIVGGHIDSWDGAGGAQDNGTGTSTTLEAARLLMDAMAANGVQPRRTIRFMLWSGEEQGLLGSRAYAEQHPEEDDRISAVLVHDGGTNACAGISATPAMMPLFEQAFGPIVAHTADNEDEVLRFSVNEVEYLPVGIGSDHDTYVRRGVPGFFWNQRGRTNYTYIHHTQHDWIDEVAEDYQHFTARVVASSAWRIANIEPMVPRDKMLAPRPKRLGVQLEGRTLKIDAISDGGLAGAAGMQAGDVLESIGGQMLESRRDLRGALTGEEQRLLVVWQRGEERMAAWLDWENETTETAEAP